MVDGARSRLSIVVLAISLALMAASGALALLLGAGPGSADPVSVLLPLAASAGALLSMFLARKLRTYYISLGLRIAAYLLTLAAPTGSGSAALLLLAGVVVELGFYEPYPRNLAEAMGVTGLAVLLRAAAAVGGGRMSGALAAELLAVVVVGLLLSLLAGQVSRFREIAVDLVADQDRLSRSVVQLTRANSVYQDVAVSAQERAAERERMRITRDIHDIVGYTLTNNIMLLEAAMDLMRENPLALPSVIETARANAEEGLGRIRAALYKLRLQEEWYPVGVDAIHRLVTLFEQATQIRVRCDFCNLPRTISERVDSTLYHLVQESLVNAFRHAHAQEVRIAFWHGEGTVRVQIADDGVGSAVVTEGIGIKGMRERVEGLGGSLEVRPGTQGFAIIATIPTGEQAGEQEDQDPHR